MEFAHKQCSQICRASPFQVRFQSVHQSKFRSINPSNLNKLCPEWPLLSLTLICSLAIDIYKSKLFLNSKH